MLVGFEEGLESTGSLHVAEPRVRFVARMEANQALGAINGLIGWLGRGCVIVGTHVKAPTG
jgi:hypothetical protein